MSEIIILTMICIFFTIKLIIFLKCHKTKGKCEKKSCKLRYWCNKYDNHNELLDYSIEHIKKMNTKQNI